MTFSCSYSALQITWAASQEQLLEHLGAVILTVLVKLVVTLTVVITLVIISDVLALPRGYANYCGASTGAAGA